MPGVSTLFFIALFASASLFPFANAQAKSRETVIYNFLGGGDGSYAWASLISDGNGHFYGTTHHGGGCVQIDSGCGTVFEITPAGKKSIVYVFQGGSDGADPYAAPVTIGKGGNLYGTTRLGATDCDGTGQGCGTVFKLTPKGTETVLYKFGGGSDGSHPDGGVIADAAGNLYGTTNFGGKDCDGTGQGCGTVFKLSVRGKKRTLYTFKGGSDGANTIAGLIIDGAGNLYGVTRAGGVDCDGSGLGCGTVFRLGSDGSETVLHAFAGGVDGANPFAAPVMDAQGNLYGTTWAGGTDSNFGIVYKVNTNGKETVLHAFNGNDGGTPYDSLVVDITGNLYGTAAMGGDSGAGVVFRLTPRGTETVLHSFADDPDGALPLGGLVMDAAGNLFGTTAFGGSREEGTVFRIGN